MTHRLYFFPNSSRSPGANPYPRNIMRLLGEEFDVVNAEKKSAYGVISILPWLTRFKVFFCGWLEDLPDRRGGFAQALLAITLLWLMRPLGVTVVWTLHNRGSHSSARMWLKSALQRLLVRRSDLIFTHAAEGVAFAKELGLNDASKIHFLHHPVDAFTAGDAVATPKEYDILVWGRADPYKGVFEFLDTITKVGMAENLRILVWGRFATDEYYKKCAVFASDHIEIRNSFIPDDKLGPIQNSARVVLFPYRPSSVLSSAALMASLNSTAQIVGPATGAFKDLAAEGCVRTYADDAAMPAALSAALADDDVVQLVERRAAFCRDNSWEQVGAKMRTLIRRELGEAPDQAAAAARAT